MTAVIHHGDCRAVLRTMEDESFHACVTDPPYGLSEHRTSDIIECLKAWLTGNEYEPKKRGFMGREWDGWVPGPTYWREVYRVLKPGGHLVAFAGTRTSDLMGIAIRLAGFEYRETCMFMHAQGFPKSSNPATSVWRERGPWPSPHTAAYEAADRIVEAFGGHGSALKPSFEPIIIARKPLDGTLVENLLAHGCGALNIDGTRIGGEQRFNPSASSNEIYGQFQGAETAGRSCVGRWPANVMMECACQSDQHDPDCPVALLDAQSGERGGCSPVLGTEPSAVTSGIYSERARVAGAFHDDAGGASRFFFIAKPSRAEREAGLEHRLRRVVNDGRHTPIDNAYQRAKTERANTHVTVKSVSLMRWLVRLVGCKRGSRILDPFVGSGSTGIACVLEGFDFDGIERDAESVDIARARILAAHEQAGSLSAEQLAEVPESTGPRQLGLLGEAGE